MCFAKAACDVDKGSPGNRNSRSCEASQNCTCHNLRYYPMSQQMRGVVEAGDLGGNSCRAGYLFPGLASARHRLELADRVGQERAIRMMADIDKSFIHGRTRNRTSHPSLCADLQTFHKTRKRPKVSVETFAGKTYRRINTNSCRSTRRIWIGDLPHGRTYSRRIHGKPGSAGRKNRLNIEIYGTKSSVVWDAGAPLTNCGLEMKHHNQMLVKDPSLMKPHARSFAELPGGHVEGYNDTLRCFDGSISPLKIRTACRNIRSLKTDIDN